jgi:hypothetical protein
MKILPVTKVASDYSEEELEQFREQFTPVAQNCHRKIQTFHVFGLVVLVIYLGIIPGSVLAGHSEYILLMIFPVPAVLFLFIAFFKVIFVEIPLFRVKCPACNNHFFKGYIEKFCPECGSNRLEVIKGRYKCRACGKALRHFFIPKGPNPRLYKIRACIHCGVLLDEKGF